MSQENVEVVRRGYGRWQGGGGTADAVPPEIFAEDVKWDLSPYPLVDVPSRGSGRDNLLDVFAQFFSGLRNYQPEAREFIDAGENVSVVLHEKAGISDSDALLERDVFHVWTLQDGLVTKWRIFPTRKEALEAAGLRE